MTVASRCSRQYVKQHAANKPRFTYMTNESDALAKSALANGPICSVRTSGG